MTEAAVALFLGHYGIVAVRAGVDAVGGGEGVAAVGHGKFGVADVVADGDIESLVLRYRQTDLGNCAEIGFVCGGGEVGRAAAYRVDEAVVADGVAEAVDLDNAFIHNQLGVGGDVIVGGDVDGDGLGAGGGAEGVLARAEDERRAVGDAVIGHIRRHVVDAGELVCRVAQARVLNLDLVAGLDDLAAGTGDVGDFAPAGFGGEHLVGGVTGGVGDADNLTAFLEKDSV